MALISLQDVSIGFGGPRLLVEINLQIESGEWVGLLGRNGMGKSTLLKLISGEILPHNGTIARQQTNSLHHRRTTRGPARAPAARLHRRQN